MLAQYPKHEGETTDLRNTFMYLTSAESLAKTACKLLLALLLEVDSPCSLHCF